MFQPGQREFVASIRARERAEIASGRKIQREKIALDRKAEQTRLSGIRQTEREHTKERQKAIREGASEGRRKAANEIATRQAVRASNREFLHSTIGNSASRVMGTIGAVGRAGAAAVGLGGAGLAAASVNQALKLDEASRRLSIAGRGPGEKGADPEALKRTFTQTGIETGVAPEQLASAAGAYVAKTGDLKTAMANMRNFAVTAQATGASVEDIASAAGDLSQKFDIKSADEMGQALAVLAFQGKKGAFELKDMAEQFPEMAAAAQRAGMTGVKGMKTLGGLAQIARQSTGSGAEASTATQMMLTQLTTKADKLKSGEALGGQRVNVFEGGDATKKARDIPTVLAEIVSKSHGNQTQLAKLFDVRGMRAVSPFVKTYRDAAEATTGSAAQKEAAGKRAVMTQIAVASDGGGTWADVEQDATDAMKATSVQLDILKTKLETAVASSLFPAISRLVPQIEELVPAVGRAASFLVSLATAFAQNPITGIGAAITLSVVKDIAEAGLGEAAKLALSGGISGMVAGGGLALALGVGAFQVGQMAVKTMMVEAQKSAEDAAASSDEVNAKALEELKTKGTLSQETRNQLEGLHNTEQSTMYGADLVSKEGFFDKVGRGARSLGSSIGINDDTGTLGEASKLTAAAGNGKYADAQIQTEFLLGLDDSSRKFAEGAENVKKIFIEAATEAGDKLKESAVSKPNRGDKPTGVKE